MFYCFYVFFGSDTFGFALIKKLWKEVIVKIGVFLVFTGTIRYTYREKFFKKHIVVETSIFASLRIV